MIVKIQHRRGAYADYDPTKVLPGELVVVQSDDPNTDDGKSIYIGTASGVIKRLATAEEIVAYNAQGAAILEQVQQTATNVQGFARTATTKAAEAAESASDAAASKSAIDDIMENAEDTINSYADAAKDDAVDGINQAYEDRVDEINDKIDEIVDVKTDAEAIATAAKNKVDDLEIDLSEVGSKADSNRAKVNTLQFDVDGMIHGWYVDVQKRLIFTDADGNPIGDPIEGIGGGGGGGGSTTNAEMSATNTTGWISKSISAGAPVAVTVLWSSIENNIPTGNGVVTIRVNGIVKSSYEVPQGEITVNLTNYLNSGTNNVKVSVSDVYDQTRTLGFNISVLDLRIASSFSSAVPFDGPIPFSYTVYGDVEKTVYIEVDGTVIHTQVTSSSGRQLTYNIPAQSHGGHSLRAYFTAVINNQTVQSNILYFEFISVATLDNTPIIISSFNTTQVNQYESVVIPYRVYIQNSTTANVELYLNNVKVSTQTVDRSEQSFTFRANDAGQLTFSIVCGTQTKTFNITVEESQIDIEPETEDLALYLTAQGRSNNEETRDVWAYNDIQSVFSGFTWRLDGWQSDNDGITVLRLNDQARVTIPYKIFGSDFKSTGKTIEIEFATRDVVDYSTTILSCFADNIGLKVTPQSVTFAGAQTSTNTLYKDNEHVRLSIVVEKQTDNRLILIYINGVMSRAIQYASGERFSQLTPVDITLGSSDCTLDIYNIRVYDNNLTRRQILTNWIADTQIGSLMLDRYDHNNVYDSNDNIPIANLPKDLPYMVLEAPELPQFKGDKKTIKLSYTDPIQASKSFTANGVQINVQGTSSAPYYRKNYDLQFKQGFITNSGTIEKYGLRADSIPFNRFVIKADVASSESANNTKLTMFYNDTCPYKTPEMLENDKVRWGIEGIPIVVYWYDPDLQTTKFLGKYNFNLPKRAPTPLGYSGNMQSWEWQRNNSDNVKFKDDDFTSTYFDEDEQTYLPVWYQDFEARMPEDTWRDYAQLKELISWVKSTYRAGATGDVFAEPVVYRLNSNTTLTQFIGDNTFTVVEEEVEGTKTGYFIATFTADTPAYRLSKFRAELDDYFERQSVLFYYLFTELFLMIDSRAKNMFIGFRGGDIDDENRLMTRKAVIEPYDMDTAIGTNNSGVLMFSYYYEDTDTVSEVISGGGSGSSNAPVYNAQDSVLWNNVRDAFKPELIVMYRNLRSTGAWSYNVVETMYEEHQAKWPEAVFNEDAYEKYLVPLIDPVTVDEETGQLIRTDRYLTMLQGSKQEQRKWWLFNRFKYLDSKYTAGTANINLISARLFADGTITITPNTNCYVAVQFGGGNAINMQRVDANDEAEFIYTAPSGVTEMETYIYSADLISDIGDMSGFYPNEVDFSKATKIRHLKLGDSSINYSNGNLRTFDVRNSTLLETIDVRNCPNLAITVNLENSPRLKEAYFDGTSITGVDLADGGALQILHLPSTITVLTLLNLNQLSELQIASVANVTRLMIANIDPTLLNPITVLETMPANSQINIQGFAYEAQDAEEIDEILDLFDTMRGVSREKDASGNWIYYDYDTAQVSGTIHTEALTGEEIAEFNARYPYIRVIADYVTSYLTFKSYDGETTIKTVVCYNGVPQESAPAVPSRPNSSDGHYSYTGLGWNTTYDQQTADPSALVDVIADRTVYPAYTWVVRTYTVYWVNNGTTIETDTNVAWGTVPHYDGTTPTKDGQTSTGWLPDATVPITGDVTFVAQYLPVYTVTFKNDTGSTTLDTQNVVQGQTATYGGTTPTSSEDASLAWLGWATSANSHQANAVLTNIQSDMTVYAAFESAVEVVEITDTWDQIIQHIDAGDYSTRYKIGNYKPLDLGTEGIINMQIVAMNADELESGGYAPLTFIGIELLNTSVAPNTWVWTSSNKIKKYLLETISPLITANVRNRIQTVKKYYHYADYAGNNKDNNHLTKDTLWIPAYYGEMVHIFESNNVYYKVFANGKTKQKADGSSSNYATRDCDQTKSKRIINEMGSFVDTNTLNGVCLGFCLGLEQETITDSWSTILANTNPSASYSIGDTKYIDLGTEGKHLMEIVAFDEDDKADNSGKAKITWLSKTLLNTTQKMNASDKTVDGETAYTAGGWLHSDMRSYLKNTIKPLIPQEVQSAIVEVTKVQSIYTNGAKVVNGQTTAEDVWIPSNYEIFGITSYESIGARYRKFASASDRIKKHNGSAYYWWLRSVDSANGFRRVGSNGNSTTVGASNLSGVALGFCTD